MHDHGEGDCRRLFELISPYLDGELEGASCSEIARHMAGCAPCERYIKSLRATRDTLRQLGRGETVPLPEADQILSECLRAVRARLGVEGLP